MNTWGKSRRHETDHLSVGDRLVHTGHCRGLLTGKVHEWTDVGSDRDAGYVWVSYDGDPAGTRPHQTSARWLIKLVEQEKQS